MTDVEQITKKKIEAESIKQLDKYEEVMVSINQYISEFQKPDVP